MHALAWAACAQLHAPRGGWGGGRVGMCVWTQGHDGISPKKTPLEGLLKF